MEMTIRPAQIVGITRTDSGQPGRDLDLKGDARNLHAVDPGRQSRVGEPRRTLPRDEDDELLGGWLTVPRHGQHGRGYTGELHGQVKVDRLPVRNVTVQVSGRKKFGLLVKCAGL